jgi:hypothetical protein
MEERYYRHSTIIRTNLVFDEWQNFLGNKSMMEALLSRVRHYCHTVTINGPSLREPSAAGSILESAEVLPEDEVEQPAQTLKIDNPKYPLIFPFCSPTMNWRRINGSHEAPKTSAGFHRGVRR